MNSYNYTTPYATSQMMMHYNHVSPTSPVSPLHPLHPANPIQHMETPAKTPVPEEVYDANAREETYYVPSMKAYDDFLGEVYDD